MYNIISIEQTKILRARHYCYLQQIGVDLIKRDSGIGYALIEHIKELCDEQGIDEIELDVWAFNSGSRKFFEKVGFEPYGFKMKASHNKI